MKTNSIVDWQKIIDNSDQSIYPLRERERGLKQRERRRQGGER